MTSKDQNGKIPVQTKSIITLTHLMKQKRCLKYETDLKITFKKLYKKGLAVVSFSKSYFLRLKIFFSLSECSFLYGEKLNAHTRQRPKRPKLIPVSLAWSTEEYCYSPLDRMLVYCRVTPQQYVAHTHLYTWVKRDTPKFERLTTRPLTPPHVASYAEVYFGAPCKERVTKP